MATPIVMPQSGNSVESCIIAEWHKKKGDTVKVGDILFTYETDKAAFEEEAKVDGILLDVFFQEDADVPVLTNVCVIGDEGEKISEFVPNAIQNGANQEVEQNDVSEKEDVQIDKIVIQNQPVVLNNDDFIKISPRAKNLSEKLGVDYRYANSTGPNGRIIERDIGNLIANGPVVTPAAKNEYLGMNAGNVTGTGLGGSITTNDLVASDTVTTQVSTEPFEEVKLSNIRKVIAKAMHQSLSTTAQLTLNTSFDATEILDYRKKLKSNKEQLGLENITLNDIVLYAVAKTLLKHRELNAHLVDDKMLLFNNVNLGVAIDTDRGLMVPNIFNANLKSLNEISAEVKAKAQECQKGTINPDYLKGGSFTVTNLGAMGIESFTPVLNPPQTGILGVSAIVQRIKEINGEYEFYPAMGLSLTFDHRAVDGAPAAKFLKDLTINLENFNLLLAK